MCWSCLRTPSPSPRYRYGLGCPWPSPADEFGGSSYTSSIVPPTGLRRTLPTYSCRSKKAMSPEPQDEQPGKASAKDPSKFGKVRPETQRQHMSVQRLPAQSQPKKQVRRRLHSRKPYQQRLLNMAEARREIVAALKFHRASMKQASERQQQQHQQQQEQEQQKQFSSLLELPPYSCCTPGDQSFSDMDSWRNLARFRSKIAPADACAYSNMSNTSSPPTSQLSNLPWSSSSISPVEFPGSLNTILPTLPLGLNLNLQSFNDIETVVTFNGCNASPLMNLCVTTPSSSAPSSSSSSAYSFSSGVFSAAEVPSVLLGTAGASEVTSEPTMDSANNSIVESKVELQSMGNEYHMDWNDRVSLVQSEWWPELLEAMKNSSEVREESYLGGKAEAIGHEIIDYPPWSCDQLHLDNFHMGAECPGELTFPCLDISEMEVLDGEWML